MILQYVGFQNSGKTTAMEWTIQQLTEKGYNVIAVKHHGHGGIPDNIVKDSTKYSDAGAVASIVEGEGVLHSHEEKRRLKASEEKKIEI